ncbi:MULTISPECIES: acetoacetate--CoA ligase [Spongiibacter]|mgnify:FL=1|uniref:acetoacetate--CoA ligase n=6 Tax=Spongiibacteraceae TaxID=1706375 RepID=UPI000C6AAB32|nr:MULTISPECIES: acetoacetate--CoA ligase [Spongiibacter]MAY39556.1 acetoacetate--CoA ligase [Spongiibacter sp.]|tara:strand:- start:11306 stop:13288 length:1983 start_codon:yes stop_codon:yes gene_type:complete
MTASQTPLWSPSPEQIANSQLSRFQAQLQARLNVHFDDYAALHRWSVERRESFWEQLWQFADVRASQSYETVLREGARFPGSQWFPGSRLNFAENLLRRRDDKTALIALREDGQRRTLTYAELFEQVALLAAAMRQRGVVAGDRVAGFMPNTLETAVAMLAASSLGAIWSSCSPDFGLSGVLDRFSQIRPKLLFAVDGYRYNGKAIDTLERVNAISSQLDSLEAVVVVPFLSGETAELKGIDRAVCYRAVMAEFATDDAVAAMQFAPLPFDHPLYIMYSSGTTGVPKCIVHGAGGTLLQHLKEHRLHCDINDDDVVFYFTTCGWMMWNWLVSALACEATVVLYDGSPMLDNGRPLLEAIDREGISVFGTSAKFLSAIQKAGVSPARDYSLASLRAILSTGSPLSEESYHYVYRDIKADLQLSSISGGTDIISCFVLGNPTLPVYAGEIQCIGLGMAVEIWDDDGTALGAGEGKGELVCTRSFPSCPIGFWNDDHGEKFHKAYFDRFENIWAHGDFAELTRHGGIIIHGRSDAILNPGGVRIGSAEIYRQLEPLDAILDSVVIGQHWQDDVRVVLFVVLREGVRLDDTLQQQIRQQIRQHTTPRHVPAKILQVSDIPRTISGKIAELAVRNCVHGDAVKNTDALANPDALDQFRGRSELDD